MKFVFSIISGFSTGITITLAAHGCYKAAIITLCVALVASHVRQLMTEDKV